MDCLCQAYVPIARQDWAQLRQDAAQAVNCASPANCSQLAAQRAEASGELRVTRHQADTGLAQGDAVEQQPNMGCFSMRATLLETIHECQLTCGLTVLAQLDAVLHLWAQVNASTLLHSLFSFREEMAPATGRLVIQPSE